LRLSPKKMAAGITKQIPAANTPEVATTITVAARKPNPTDR
jgi:hypothetical protein